jgi:hypothetical protein
MMDWFYWLGIPIAAVAYFGGLGMLHHWLEDRRYFPRK